MKTKLDDLTAILKQAESELSGEPSEENASYALGYTQQSLKIITDLPPYDREAFRRQLIVSLANAIDPRTTGPSELINTTDAIIAEYERRQNEQR
jgi:hypothetical protein